MKHDIAEHVMTVINSCIAQLLETLPFIEDQVSAEEFKPYKRAVGKVINTIDMEIVERVTADHPDLQPWGEEPRQGPD